MPKTIEIPGQGIAEFPDEMPEAQIDSILARDFNFTRPPAPSSTIPQLAPTESKPIPSKFLNWREEAIPKPLTPAQFKAQVNPISGSEFGKGVAQGIAGVASGVLGTGEIMASLLGADGVAEWMKRKADDIDAVAANIPLNVPSLKELESNV